MDWFVCNAASQQLQSPPSNERISFRHAFLSALQDKTAFAITSCFEASVKELHMALFPNSSISISAADASLDDPPFDLVDDFHNSLSTQAAQHSLANDTHPLSRVALPLNSILHPITSALSPLPPPAELRPASNHSMHLRARSSSSPPSLVSAQSPRAQSVKAFLDSHRSGSRRKSVSAVGGI